MFPRSTTLSRLTKDLHVGKLSRTFPPPISLHRMERSYQSHMVPGREGWDAGVSLKFRSAIWKGDNHETVGIQIEVFSFICIVDEKLFSKYGFQWYCKWNEKTGWPWRKSRFEQSWKKDHSRHMYDCVPRDYRLNWLYQWSYRWSFGIWLRNRYNWKI